MRIWTYTYGICAQQIHNYYYNYYNQWSVVVVSYFGAYIYKYDGARREEYNSTANLNGSAFSIFIYLR